MMESVIDANWLMNGFNILKILKSAVDGSERSKFKSGNLIWQVSETLIAVIQIVPNETLST